MSNPQRHRVKVTDDAQALELEVERAWCSLTKWPTTIWLTPKGKVLRAAASDTVAGAEYVGRYTKAVLLVDFRGDVFHIFEAMTRRGSHGQLRD